MSLVLYLQVAPEVCSQEAPAPQVPHNHVHKHMKKGNGFEEIQSLGDGTSR